MKIFHSLSLNKSVVYLLSFTKESYAFSIYLPYFTNDLTKQFLVFAGMLSLREPSVRFARANRTLCSRRCLTDKTKSGYM